MPTDVRHLLDGGQPYPVVRLSGVLDHASAEGVRSALLEGLLGQPAALVVDVSDLAVADPAAVGVLRDVARDVADWPATELVVCVSHDAARWRATGLPVWPSRAAAFAALGSPDPVQQLSVALDPVVGAARRSRELVSEGCAAWDLPELAGPACIVVTELVNNVVAHARTTMTVRLALRGGELTVAVQDRSPALPSFHGVVAPTAYGGRGLLLIDSVARRWGNLGLDGGKVVWAILSPEDEALDSARRAPTAAGDNA